MIHTLYTKYKLLVGQGGYGQQGGYGGYGQQQQYGGYGQQYGQPQQGYGMYYFNIYYNFNYLAEHSGKIHHFQ